MFSTAIVTCVTSGAFNFRFRFGVWSEVSKVCKAPGGLLRQVNPDPIIPAIALDAPLVREACDDFRKVGILPEP